MFEQHRGLLHLSQRVAFLEQGFLFVPQSLIDIDAKSCLTGFIDAFKHKDENLMDSKLFHQAHASVSYMTKYEMKVDLQTYKAMFCALDVLDVLIARHIGKHLLESVQNQRVLPTTCQIFVHLLTEKHSKEQLFTCYDKTCNVIQHEHDIVSKLVTEMYSSSSCNVH